RDIRKAVALGEQAGFARDIKIELRLNDPESRARQSIVKAQQHLAGFDFAALLDKDLSDDAAVEVLDLFDVALDHDATRRDDGAGNVGRGGPADETAEAEDQSRAAQKVQPADRVSRIAHHGRHHADSAVAAATTLSRVVAATAGGSGATACKISRQEPKACCAPSRSTRTLSHTDSKPVRCVIRMTMAPRAFTSRTASSSAASPSPSRLAFGSSSTIRNGSP